MKYLLKKPNLFLRFTLPLKYQITFGYEKYHSVAVGTGECGDGQHICAGRAGDGGRADAVLSGGDVLFYGGNEV